MMKRLTFAGLFCDIAMCTGVPGTGPCKDGSCSQREAWERLKTVEDVLGADYDLDILRKVVQAFKEGRYIILKDPERDGVDRLRELADADQEGRCVVLPCKVGDDVYSAYPLCGVNSHHIRFFKCSSDGNFACSALMIPFSDFGKTVFLTREEAEAAWKKEANSSAPPEGSEKHEQNQDFNK